MRVVFDLCNLVLTMGCPVPFFIDEKYIKVDMSSKNASKKKILFLVTEDWYFCSHRLPLAVVAKKSGYDVLVATRIQRHGGIITQNGLILIPICMRRRSNNLFDELRSLLDISRIYLREKPDIVHHVAIKPVIFGSFVAIFFKNIRVVNAIAGLGFVFTSKRMLARLLRPIIKLAFRVLLNRSTSKLIVQNPDDSNLLVKSLNINENQIALIRGAGVDLSVFNYVPEPKGEIVVVLISRMLWDKGIGEFVQAVKQLKKNGLNFRAILRGSPDVDNPASVTRLQLEKWNDEGYVEFGGHSNDVSNVWANSHISVLPSYYGEGIPKSLIEAAACGRPIITTDMPGCREIVINEVNGLLVPPRDVDSLANAMAVLIKNKTLRKRMGKAGKERVEKEFSEDIVIKNTLSLYESLLK